MRTCRLEVIQVRAEFPPLPRVPHGLEDVSKYPDLVAELLRRGWTQTEVEAALAKNLIRVFEEVEQVSRNMHTQRPDDEPIPYKEIESDCHTGHGYNTGKRQLLGPALLLVCLLCTLLM
ncbi:hypothetical protein FKM82_027093 [Ascaphus truei]